VPLQKWHTSSFELHVTAVLGSFKYLRSSIVAREHVCPNDSGIAHWGGSRIHH
jgi:hypothetical protein